MVQFELKLNTKGYGSIPVELRKSWGHRMTIIPNDSAGVIFGENTDLMDVERSLEILLDDVKHRRERKEREEKKERDGGEEQK